MKDALTNPEELASSERVRTYLRCCREAVLAELQASDQEIERGLDLHRHSIVCDLMGGAMGSGGIYSPALEEFILRRLSETGADDFVACSEIRNEVAPLLPRELVGDADLRADHWAVEQASGVNLGVVTTKPNTVAAMAQSVYLFDEIDCLEKVVHVGQVEHLKKENRRGLIYHAHEAAHAGMGVIRKPDGQISHVALASDHYAGRLLDGPGTPVDDLEVLYGLGIRWAQLWHSDFGGKQWEPERGLTDLGRQAVQRMNALGIIVDTSHCAPQSALAAVQASEQPPVVSHVGCMAVHPGYCSGRNITDETMKAVAEKGGVVGICSVRTLIGENSVEMFMRHVDHAAQLIGTDHIGFSTDANVGMALEPPELVEASKPKQWNRANPWNLTRETREQHAWMGNASEAAWKMHTGPHVLACCNFPFWVTAALVQRGYADDAIEKMLGGNFLRVARTVLGS